MLASFIARANNIYRTGNNVNRFFKNFLTGRESMKFIAFLLILGLIVSYWKYFLYFIAIAGIIFIILVIVGLLLGKNGNLDSGQTKPKKERTIWDNWKVRAIDTDKIDNMTGVEFEQWCAHLLKYLGANNIQFTKGSGDQGVDIIADWHGKRYAIQCKRYANPLGNKPIQEVYAGMQYYHCTAGAVMTNRTFTSGGKALAQSTGVELWDRPWLEKAADQTMIKQAEITDCSDIEEIERDKTPYIYTDGVDAEMETGKWPHQYAKEIDIDYFRPLMGKPHPEFDVTGRARFPAVNPYTINVDSIITVETEPFERKEDAELFAEYAEGHFAAKVRIEEAKRKYIVVIQTHVFSIQSNYREETETFDL